MSEAIRLHHDNVSKIASKTSRSEKWWNIAVEEANKTGKIFYVVINIHWQDMLHDFLILTENELMEEFTGKPADIGTKFVKVTQVKN